MTIVSRRKYGHNNFCGLLRIYHFTFCVLIIIWVLCTFVWCSLEWYSLVQFGAAWYRLAQPCGSWYREDDWPLVRPARPHSPRGPTQAFCQAGPWYSTPPAYTTSSQPPP